MPCMVACTSERTDADSVQHAQTGTPRYAQASKHGSVLSTRIFDQLHIALCVKDVDVTAFKPRENGETEVIVRQA